VELSRLRTEIAQSDSGAPVVLRGPFGIDEQRLLVRDLLGRLGFDEREWRVDEAAHPFLAAIAPTDIRLTTRYREDGFDSILAALHEFGHGMYAHGVDPALARTPLGTSASTALDESQSRFWENVIGRSQPFAQFLHPLLAERFPAALAGTDAESLYRALNVVEPSPIRVTADEVHYSLHVIVRFEVERELIAGTLAATDIAARFDALMEEYVGLEPTTDALGALQDVHWWAGAFGYFPTYALGNVMSLQVVERLKKEVPALEENVAAGRFGPIQDWLRESIYRHGAKHTGAEVLERVTGHRLEAGPYVRYLRGKFGPLYGLAG
jgi:carboxypeptidase Taq